MATQGISRADVRVFSLEGLAAVIGVSEAVLRREDKAGRLPYHVFGKRRLYRPEEVLRATLVPGGLPEVQAAATVAEVPSPTPVRKGMTEAELDALAEWYPEVADDLRRKAAERSAR